MTAPATTRAVYDRRRRRRFGLRVVVALSIGLVTTIGAAWACALWSPSSRLVTAVVGAGQPSHETGIGVAGTIRWRETPAVSIPGSPSIMCGGEGSTDSIEMPAMLS